VDTAIDKEVMGNQVDMDNKVVMDRETNHMAMQEEIDLMVNNKETNLVHQEEAIMMKELFLLETLDSTFKRKKLKLYLLEKSSIQ
jgi:hypothetical protein